MLFPEARARPIQPLPRFRARTRARRSTGASVDADGDVDRPDAEVILEPIGASIVGSLARAPRLSVDLVPCPPGIPQDSSTLLAVERRLCVLARGPGGSIVAAASN